MRDAGLKAAALARTANVSPSTVTRLIYGGVANPDTDTLGRIAAALIDAQLDPRTASVDRDTAVAAKHGALLAAAGHHTGVDADPAVYDPLVLELQRMIGSDSPLSREDIEFLRAMTSRLIDPYRSQLQKRSV
jgi:transcriptional regulator with XRE-family HTH domain